MSASEGLKRNGMEKEMAQQEQNTRNTACHAAVVKHGIASFLMHIYSLNTIYLMFS